MSRSYQLGALVAGLGVIVIALLLPIVGATAKRGVQTKSLSNAKQLATACRLYAVDHEGRLPIHFDELAPDYLARGDVGKLRYICKANDDDPDLLMDWLYFGAGFDDKNAPRIVIASPQAFESDDKKHGRIVIAPDTSGTIVPEATYQEQLAETIKQIRALEDERRSRKSSPAKAEPAGK